MSTWHILGAGSMGLLWASALAAGGRSVVLRTRAGSVPGRGRITRSASDGGQMTFETDILPADADEGPIDAMLVAVKAPDTRMALESLRTQLHRDSVIVLMQNGMGVADELSAARLPGRLYTAVTTEGAYRAGPLAVTHAGRGDTVVGDGPDAPRIVADLAAGGHAVTAVGNIEERQWAKLAVNCVINPVTALLDCPNGRIAEPGAAADAAHALAQEVQLAAHKLGRASAVGDVWARALAVATATAANRSSMRQDLAAGRRTEIDYLNGYLLTLAAGRGLALPCNRLITDLIHAREPDTRPAAADPRPAV